MLVSCRQVAFIVGLRLSGMDLSGLDPTQVSYLSEEVILVTQDDQPRGSATKRDAHLWEKVQSGEMLHRAFSVFIFNSEKKLLLQKRAATKITFPGQWTNSCCSHPLLRAEETAEGVGVLRAARRKIRHELGFSPESVSPSDLRPITRILYQARCPAPQSGWGEHELDHVLFLTNFNHLPTPNPNEVHIPSLPPHLSLVVG